MRSLGVTVLLALIAAALAGCGGGAGESGEVDGSGEAGAKPAAQRLPAALPPQAQDREIWVAMDGWDDAEALAFPMAQEKDYFSKYQLDVLTLSPVTPKLSIPDVVKRQDNFAVAHGPEAVLAKDRGAPIAIVGSFVPQPTAALIWPQGAGMKAIADLKGKTIAIPGLPFQRDFLATVMAAGGLTLDEVKVKSVGNKLVPALLHGRADAIFGGSPNVEGVELRDRGVEPVVRPVGGSGVPSYEELVLVARRDWAAETSVRAPPPGGPGTRRGHGDRQPEGGHRGSGRRRRIEPRSLLERPGGRSRADPPPALERSRPEPQPDSATDRLDVRAEDDQERLPGSGNSRRPW